jgi:protein-S-isoprenylcysteine O-methyltransferase Ste14
MQNHVRRDMIAFAIPAFLVFSGGLGICGWDFVRRHDGALELSALNVFGGFLVVAALVHNVACQVTMGRSYSASLVTREDHQLITRGMYRYVRHPIYLGVITAATGIALFTSSLLGLIVLWGLIPVFLRRIRMEERMLIDEFGVEYEKYMESTRTLFPFLY